MAYRKRSQTIVATSVEEYVEKSIQQFEESSNTSSQYSKKKSSKSKKDNSLLGLIKFQSLPTELSCIPEEDIYDDSDDESQSDSDNEVLERPSIPETHPFRKALNKRTVETEITKFNQNEKKTIKVTIVMGMDCSKCEMLRKVFHESEFILKNILDRDVFLMGYRDSKQEKDFSIEFKNLRNPSENLNNDNSEANGSYIFAYNINDSDSFRKIEAIINSFKSTIPQNFMGILYGLNFDSINIYH